MLVKLEFITEDDAQCGAYYFSDRGYEVRMMGKAVVVEDPDNSDLAVVMTTYMANGGIAKIGDSTYYPKMP